MPINRNAIEVKNIPGLGTIVSIDLAELFTAPEIKPLDLSTIKKPMDLFTAYTPDDFAAAIDKLSDAEIKSLPAWLQATALYSLMSRHDGLSAESKALAALLMEAAIAKQLATGR